MTPSAKRTTLALIYLTLLVDVVAFFAKPLFSPNYSFPWDFRGVQLPMLTFLRDQLSEGHFALWNPFSYCGYPVFANIEGCFYQPLVLLGVLVSTILPPASLPKLIEWAVVLQVWGAGIAAYHLFEELGTTRPAAWMGAIIFQTGGYFASQAEHIGAVMAVVWMPFTWLAILKLSRRWSRPWFAALCGALGLSVLGGFPQPTLSVYIAAVVWALLLAIFRFARPRIFVQTIAACAIGIVLAAVQFVPTTQLSENSVAKYRAGWLGAGGGLYPQSLVSLIFPNHYNIFDMSAFKGPSDPTFLYLYVGIGGLLLAAFAAITRKNRYGPAMLVMCLFAAWLMLGEHAPLWGYLYPLLPEKVRIGIHPEYTYGIFTLSLASLAAMGLGSLAAPSRAKYALGIVVAVDLWAVGSGRPMNCASVELEPGVTRQSFAGSSELLGEVRRLSRLERPPARIDTVGNASMEWSVHGPVTRIPTANGVSPLALENIIQLRLLLHDGDPWGWYYPIEKLESPVINLMGSKYLLATTAARGRMEKYSQFRHLRTLPLGHEVYENLAVLPRFFLVHDVRMSRSSAEARQMIARGEIDFRHTALLDHTYRPSPLAESGAKESVRVHDYQADAISLQVRSNGASLLVLSENYYPGWRAWVDGKPAEIWRADIAFRGVPVPDGSHEVRMEFHPVILPVSLGVSVLTGIVLAALAWSARVKPIAAEPGANAAAATQ